MSHAPLYTPLRSARAHPFWSQYGLTERSFAASRHDDDDEDEEWIRVPLVVDKRGKSEELVDLYSRMLRDRVVFIGGGIGGRLADVVCAQLLYLANEDPKAEISLYINSPGGSISAGLAMIDTMRFVQCPVATYIVGQAASMASLIACCGTKGRRFALNHADNLMHQGRIGSYEGQATDLEVFTRQMVRVEDVCNKLYADATGQTMEKIAADCDRDLWLDSKEMLAYGLIDKIIHRMPAATGKDTP